MLSEGLMGTLVTLWALWIIILSKKESDSDINAADQYVSDG